METVEIEMMEDEHSKIIKLAAEFFMVYSVQCRYCNDIFATISNISPYFLCKQFCFFK